MAAFKTVITTLALATVMAAPAVAQQRERRRPNDSGNQPQQTDRAREQQPAREREQARQGDRAVQRTEPRQDAQRQDQARREEQARANEQRRVEESRRYDNNGRAYDNRGYNTRGYDNRGYDNRGYDSRRYATRDYAVRRVPPRIIRPEIARVVTYRPYVYRPSLRIGVYYGYDGYYPYGYTPRGYFEPIPGRLYGGVRITGAPREAQVFADGYYVGIVNDFDGIFQHINLEAGPHHIEVDWGAGEPIAFDVYVRPGETTTFRADGYFRY